MASPPSSSDELLVTVLSAKHLKNVNWRRGELKPYAVAYLDPDRRLATKPDGSNSTKPVWNETLTLTLPPAAPPHQRPRLLPLFLTLEIFHSKPSETPKPLVGTARVPIGPGPDDDDDSPSVRTLDVLRPSGRPHGKIKIKIALLRKRRYDYSSAPPPPLSPSAYYYSSSAPPVRDYYCPREFSPLAPTFSRRQWTYGTDYCPDHYYGYYEGGPYYGRYDGGPLSEHGDCNAEGERLGLGAAAGVTGALGGLSLGEATLKPEEEHKIAERAGSDLPGPARDSNDFRPYY